MDMFQYNQASTVIFTIFFLVIVVQQISAALGLDVLKQEGI
jgi:ABC-type phosphate/phosphonate transport system permease subunit